MEYIFGLSGGRRAVLYDEGNLIHLLFVGSTRGVQGGIVGRDYHSCLCCAKIRDEICVAYINVGNELVWYTAGREGRLILLSDTGNVWEIRELQLVSGEEEAALFYLVQNPVTGESEIRYLFPEGDRKGRVLKSEKEKIETYHIVKRKEVWHLSYDLQKEEKNYLFQIEKPDSISMEECVFCKKAKLEEQSGQYKKKETENAKLAKQCKQREEELAELKKQCKKNEQELKIREDRYAQKEKEFAELEKKFDSREKTFSEERDKHDKEWERRMKMQADEMEKSFRSQYDELAGLTTEIQKEGKRWRELYYKYAQKGE